MFVQLFFFKNILTVQGDFDNITNVDWVELCFKVLAMKILAKIM